MLSQELLRSEAAHYRDLAEQLRATYSGIDDETLADTLSGINELPDMIEEIVRSSLEDQCVIAAIKLRAEDLKARLERFEQRVERKRALACWAMGSAGIPKLQAADFSVGLREGQLRLEVVDETKIPDLYRVPQPAKLDRTRLAQDLKQGTKVEGAALAAGLPYIAVRTR